MTLKRWKLGQLKEILIVRILFLGQTLKAIFWTFSSQRVVIFFDIIVRVPDCSSIFEMKSYKRQV